MNILFIILLAKLIHIMFLWFTFYIAEKVAIDDFITAVYVEEGEPASLMKTVLRVFISDFVFCTVFMLCLYIFMARSSDQPILGGMAILYATGSDLYMAWTLCFLLSTTIAWVSQSQSCCRYKDDGLRGTRAYCYTALCISAIVCLPPYYLVL